MRKTRLSIGCHDWQEITAKIGPAATGVLLYLRLAMRNMQASEITISTAELAEALKLDEETVGNLLCLILDTELLDAVPGPDGLTTYQSKEEAAALADRFRKRATAARRKLAAMSANLIPHLSGNSGPEIPAEIPADTCKAYETEVFMEYHTPGGNSGRESREKEKAPHTPEKEKSLTESTGRAHASAPVREAANASTRRQMSAATRADEVTLAADQLEAEYIDICGLMPQSLRDSIKAETADVREAFYLYVRQRREEEGSRWAGDRIRIAWLAARRIPAERRAESILAASMGGWKTIRDAGSGCYFEKTTGRIVSLVRGTVEYKQQNETEKTNAELAVKLARNMRRG